MRSHLDSGLIYGQVTDALDNNNILHDDIGTGDEGMNIFHSPKIKYDYTSIGGRYVVIQITGSRF